MLYRYIPTLVCHYNWLSVNNLKYYIAWYVYYKYSYYISGNTCHPNPSDDDQTTLAKLRNCCTPDTPCGLGGGDCDSNHDCKGDLICGRYQANSNNCKNEPAIGLIWPANTDCCIAKRNSNDFVSIILIFK